MPRPELFISYGRKSSASTAFLEDLEPALEAAGAARPRDEDIRFGDDWADRLIAWLAACHGAVVLLSPEAFASKWCAREVEYLLHRRQRAEHRAAQGDRFDVMPVLLGGATWDDVRAQPAFAGLARFQGQADPDAVLGKLAEAVQRLADAVSLSRGTTPQVPPPGSSRHGRWCLSPEQREALQELEETVAIRRQLAQTRPDAILPDLAVSLTNLGTIRSALGQWEEALQATEEAVATYRQLTKTHPDTFLPSLARSLGAYGNSLLELTRNAEAVEAYGEALTLVAPLVQQHPEAFAGLARITWTGFEGARAPNTALAPPVREAHDVLVAMGVLAGP